MSTEELACWVVKYLPAHELSGFVDAEFAPMCRRPAIDCAADLDVRGFPVWVEHKDDPKVRIYESIPPLKYDEKRGTA